MSVIAEKPLRRIVYIHIGTFPSNQVHTIQVMRMCEGLQQAGYTPILIGRATPSPGKDLDEPKSLFEYYGIDTPFDFELLRLPEFETWPQPLRVISFFLCALYLVLFARKYQPDAVYTRDPYTALIATLLQIPLIMEEHAPPLRSSQLWLRRRYYSSRVLLAVVLISQALKEMYVAMGLLSGCQTPAIVAHDAASHSQIRPIMPAITGPDILDTIRVGYIGSLLPGRGIDLILAVAQELPEFEFRIVGGKPAEIGRLAGSAPANVAWSGFVAPGALQAEFATLQILLMPYQEDTATHGGARSARWMSPLKMFEYMASGIPLIASDLPVLREVLTSDHNCILVPPANIDAWRRAIVRLSADRELRRRLATEAQADVLRTHNWATRAQNIAQVALQEKDR